MSTSIDLFIRLQLALQNHPTTPSAEEYHGMPFFDARYFSMFRALHFDLHRVELHLAKPRFSIASPRVAGGTRLERLGTAKHCALFTIKVPKFDVSHCIDSIKLN